jgi:hypothetical protein
MGDFPIRTFNAQSHFTDYHNMLVCSFNTPLYIENIRAHPALFPQLFSDAAR